MLEITKVTQDKKEEIVESSCPPGGCPPGDDCNPSTGDPPCSPECIPSACRPASSGNRSNYYKRGEGL